MQHSTLNQLTEGETARVETLLASGAMRQRLLDLGLIEGTSIACVHKSPFGDPTAYCIRGAMIALRAEDAAQIVVQRDKIAVGDAII